MAQSTVNSTLTQEFFQFKEIQKIIHYPDAGVEIVFFNGTRRVFYNNGVGESLVLFNTLNDTMLTWMGLN